MTFAQTPANDAGVIRYDTLKREFIEARLQRYQGNDEQREHTLKQLFSEAGCDALHLSEQTVNGSKLPNLICVLPGKSGKTIIIGAHYDHVRAGDGVVDNWSGASLLPSLYESVKSQPRDHSYIFIGFTDEEKGLVGSDFYVRHMTRDQVAAADAMVNMDTLGLAPTEVWASHSDRLLTTILIYVSGQLKVPVTGVNVERVGKSDGESFAQRKIPRITIHSLTQKTWDENVLHSSKDKISAIQLDDYYDTYRLLAGYIASLDRYLSPSAPESSH